MSYVKTNWVARVGTALNRFLKTNEDAGSVELTNDPTGITTAGTPFTVANMNNIETGIKDNDDRSLNNETDNGTQDTAIGFNTTHRGLTNNPHSVDKSDLSLDTTDDVTFNDITVNDIDANSIDTNAIVATSLNTGQGANELYDMDQNVKTTNSPHWANINPPVDNSDNTLPAIGIGGFTYGIGDSSGNITLPSGGTYIWSSRSTSSTAADIGRSSGGTVISQSVSFNILVWRIA